MKGPCFWRATGLGKSRCIGSGFVGGSTLPPHSTRFEPCLDASAALGNYLPVETAFRQARALPPASHARIKTGDRVPQINTYWRMDFSSKRVVSLGDGLDEFESLIANAVDIRLPADVPVALTFSGGRFQHHCRNSSKFLQQTSVLLDHLLRHRARSQRGNSHCPRSGRTAWSGLALQTIRLPPGVDAGLAQGFGLCGSALWPHGHQLFAATLRCHPIRSEAKVVLSGNGADELLLG